MPQNKRNDQPKVGARRNPKGKSSQADTSKRPNEETLQPQKIPTLMKMRNTSSN
jgi:hypothetical protein